ncbi:hypothetical protein XENTR_v10004460 [Xenopus tropicalis]|uniref:E3 ubiquitin-protein ligase Midline-1 n=1 Tax=Xenopus tropicalis TaxID=8364 RepID=A0A1B8Y710_XENTR|nr:E3 ubiquitin-protein ligase Midline-1 [Xenopus tropicalis]KAE8577185.1 hypothetical protein XENTR_v10004460 [Xenopus tropicalis]|eukprot:XP_017945126.1 PREDICTED: E3 ubiquitin-protein ligase Midline-1-like [Xenopus tropicalis]
MASELREELYCSICLEIYTDPATLPCGHNFCQGCIGRVLGTQEGSGVYRCPVCREKYPGRPALRRNTVLSNIAEHFRAAEPQRDGTAILCTYCTHSPTPAAKTCLHCGASLCDTHVGVHPESAEHVLTEPTASTRGKLCCIHKEARNYYCPHDDVCICASCCLVGEHRGHQVEPLSEASEKKKEKLRQLQKTLSLKREQTEAAAQSLERHRREEKNRVATLVGTFTALFKDMKDPLRDEARRSSYEISNKENQVSTTASALIGRLEARAEELTIKVGYIEDLCNMVDPLTVLQEWESDSICTDLEEDLQLMEELQGVHGTLRAVGAEAFVTLHTRSADLLPDVKPTRWFDVQVASDLRVDEDTAANNVVVTRDLTTVSWSGTNQHRTESPKRFQSCQALSCRAFSSGKHYWAVDASESGDWMLGVAYPTIERRGSFIGYGNSKSWCLCRCHKGDAMMHGREVRVLHKLSCCKFGIYLDYEAGRLSFYELSAPIRHLHTFTATFTEPLHPVFCVSKRPNSPDISYCWIRLLT